MWTFVKSILIKNNLNNLEKRRMMRIAVIYLLAVLLMGCISNNTYSNHSNSNLDIANINTIKISEIKNNIDIYKGKLVKIEGIYMGWQGSEPPPVTRSDWVIRDETGEIYITGMIPNLDPCKDIGKNITVIGWIEVTEKGKIYIRAVNIIY